MKRFSLTAIFILILLLAPFTQAFLVVPVTGDVSDTPNTSNNAQKLPSLVEFTNTVKSGKANVVSGIYVPGVMAFPIVQQTGSDAAYVSTQPDTITQFRMASQYNSIGLLAHDYLAGASFTNLQAGQDVVLVYGDGTQKYYRIYDAQRYQALSPNSASSNFVDLKTQTQISAEQLFYRTYGLGQNTLVLQTCISTEKVSSWGRLFILARPLESNQISLVQALPALEKALNSAAQSLKPLQTAQLSAQ